MSSIPTYGPTDDGRFVTPYQGQLSILTIETTDVESDAILVRSDHAGSVSHAIFERTGRHEYTWRCATRELSESEIPRLRVRIQGDWRIDTSTSYLVQRQQRWLESTWRAEGGAVA